MALTTPLLKEEEIKMNISNRTPQAKETSLESLINTVHNNKFSLYYSKDSSIFKERIDKLNLKFYLESEKYLSNKTSQGKCQDSLFLILFQQIGIYIEEIERLNALLYSRKDNPNHIKERIEESANRQKEFETKEMLIHTLKEANKKLELQLYALITNEDKLKLEIERLKQQNSCFKEKVKIFLLTKHNEIDIISQSFKEAENRKDSEETQQSGLMSGVGNSKSPSVLNIKKTFVRKRNNSDHSVNNAYSNAITQEKKQSRIIKTLKVQTEAERNGARWNSPIIGSTEEGMGCSQQMNSMHKMECFLKEIKHELYSSKANKAQGMPIDYSQNYSELNLKTEVISDIEDFEGGVYKNSALALCNRKEVNLAKQLPTARIKPQAQPNSTGRSPNQMTNGKLRTDKSSSNTNTKAKKTCKIISHNNNGVKR